MNLKIYSPLQIGPLTVGRTGSGYCILDTRTNDQRTGFSTRKSAEKSARAQLDRERARAFAEKRVCLRCARTHDTPQGARNAHTRHLRKRRSRFLKVP
jgi:hypothetical protein